MGEALLGVAAAALLVGAAVAAFSGGDGGGSGFPGVHGRFGAEETPRLGSADAPVTIFAFESPACSSCRHFHVGGSPSLYDRLVEEYVDTGRVRYVWKSFTLGYPWEGGAVDAQRCVWHEAPERFEPFTLAIYRVQDRLSAANFATFFDEWARAEGLDAAALAACAEERRHSAGADADAREARRAGVRGTPTFVIVGPDGETSRTLVGPRPFPEFRDAIAAVAPASAPTAGARS